MYYVRCTKKFMTGVNAGKMYDYRVPFADVKAAKRYYERMRQAQINAVETYFGSGVLYVTVGSIILECED